MGLQVQRCCPQPSGLHRPRAPSLSHSGQRQALLCTPLFHHNLKPQHSNNKTPLCSPAQALPESCVRKDKRVLSSRLPRLGSGLLALPDPCVIAARGPAGPFETEQLSNRSVLSRCAAGRSLWHAEICSCAP